MGRRTPGTEGGSTEKGSGNAAFYTRAESLADTRSLPVVPGSMREASTAQSRAKLPASLAKRPQIMAPNYRTQLKIT